MTAFNGLGTHLGNLSWVANAQSRSISAENFTGEKGKGGMATDGASKSCVGDLGIGWKMSPKIVVKPGEVRELADIAGPGAIQHLWITQGNTALPMRWLILRIYWDAQEQPSVECPLGDFFANGWGGAQVNSLAVTVNPKCGQNCYWEMPFRRRCRITLESLLPENTEIYYQIDYALAEVPEQSAYFHAQFRRENPTKYKVPYTILDGVRGRGQYIGTYLAWGVNNGGWWGEGEIKFYLDGDREYPTICGTGTEDYICGSHDFENADGGPTRYVEYNTAYAGLPQVIRPDGLYRSQQRFGMYRWHIPDPIRFASDLRITVQALGWRSGWKFLPLQDDIASVAFWYQQLPTAPFPSLPGKDLLEVI
ncbi:MAG: DUF2961 domain-containing protein [Planctomycetes bacterium]|nr:DUF2961 domain-containing protein [Planctomycetota bacterium]